METEGRRKGPRSPSADSDESSRRRRSRKYDRDRSPSPRRSRYRRSRSRDRRSDSRERRRKDNRSQDWNKSIPPNQNPPLATNASAASYVPPIYNQYQAPPPPNTTQPPPPIQPYSQGYNSYGYNYNQGYDYSNYQQPAGYRSDYPPPNWPAGQVSYNNQPSQQPQPTMPPTTETARPVDTVAGSRPDDVKKEAIAAEVKHQKATLQKQREEYVKKASALEKDLEKLRQQYDEIGKEGGRENDRIIKENQKLQGEIQTKMKTIYAVIDMLTGIIGDKATVEDLKCKYKEMPSKRVKSPKEELPRSKAIKSPEKLPPENEKELKDDRDRKPARIIEEDSKPLYNFVYYDPEMHWCKVCDIFPKTAKEYLNHLHSNQHKETCLERKIVDMPWHERDGEGAEKKVPYYPNLPTKRTPIKGLQFFSPATAWYCKLCDAWIGDLHCASFHLKSKRHSENFSQFVDQNPHWETDWMADREKASSDERQKQLQMELQKQKEDEPQAKSKKSKKSKKNKKKSKKRKNKSSNSDSSSDSENSESDSDQDMSKSIRVAMRNKMKSTSTSSSTNQPSLNDEIDYHGIKLKGHWSHVSSGNKPMNSDVVSQENEDRQLLNSIRDNIKSKQDEATKVNRKSSSNNITSGIGGNISAIGDVKVNINQENEIDNEKSYLNKLDPGLDAWGPKEPPKSFWIKKDDEKNQTLPTKPIDIPKPEDMPKPHMGFWTKQQVNMTVKPQDNKTSDKEDDRDRLDRGDRHKEDKKYDRRDDKYHGRYDNYDRRRGGGGGRERERDRDRERNERDRDRDRDYYDDRRKDKRNDDSPRRGWRESPKRNYDKYKERRDDDSNDESKYDKKMDSKLKKNPIQTKKQQPSQSSKGKLPFIGRLPLFKKKTDDLKITDKDIAPLPYVQSKFEDTPKVPSDIINPPGVVHITKLATPVAINSSANNSNSTNVANNTPTKQSTMKIIVAPPPPVLNASKVQMNSTAPVSSTATALPTNPPQVVDMEIDDQNEETIIEETTIDKISINNLSTTDVQSSPPPPLPASSASALMLPNQTATVAPGTAIAANGSNPAYNGTRAPLPPPPPPPPQSPFVTPGFSAAQPTAMPPYPHPPPMASPYVQPPVVMDQAVIDGQEIPDADKRTDSSSQPLPEDLQEALNIIFPKDESESGKDSQMDTMMYASMYSSMLGCVGYGPEYMDHPPPEITQTETETESQPGPDDLKMLGIDEGDTIF